VLHGATTIWERWDGWTEDKGFQDPGMNSFNHYAFGAVGEWMYETIGGIGVDPAQPGYRHILIRPQPGKGVTWAKTSLDSIRGRVAVHWRIEDGRLTLEVTIPANTTATVRVPTLDPNGVVESGHPVVETDGLISRRAQAGALVCEVAAGRYVFQAPHNQ
jgi:alpha-L-rhamnosidase